VLRARGIFVPQSNLQMINYPPSPAESTPQGNSNKVILDEMHMSRSTVTVHFSAKSFRNIMKKIQVIDRTKTPYALRSSARKRPASSPRACRQAGGYNSAMPK
jgi:hypothetical protein